MREKYFSIHLTYGIDPHPSCHRSRSLHRRTKSSAHISDYDIASHSVRILISKYETKF